MSATSRTIRSVRRALFPGRVALCLTLALGPGTLVADAANDRAGYGPAISLPRTSNTNRSSKLHTLIDQTRTEALAKSRGCLQCHQGIEEMHASPNVVLGCTDCHGGNATPDLLDVRKAHVLPRHPEFWTSSANPNDANVLLNHESAEFIQFINPTDLRVAEKACGSCHQEAVARVGNSMMRHGAMLWGAALYNNGSVPHKNYRYGQAYGADGAPLTLLNPVPVTEEETRRSGVLRRLEPLPRFPVSQPGNTLRIFEKGGEKPLSLGLPLGNEPPGRPFRRLSERGLGTQTRIDPVFLNLQKTRLHDPLLDFMGSNNHPGDYRSSGCAACHVVYANDRSPTHSGGWSQYGHQGLSFTGDPMISKKERGHPIKHRFTRSIPSSQCMSCHMHQGNLFVNPYLGYTWWDQESDGEVMYPREQKKLTDEDLVRALRDNPEEAAARGLWGDPDFLEKVSEKNPVLEHNQFADYHGHGWVFRAVFKKDRQGALRDLEDAIIPHDDPKKFAKAVHLKDAHLAHGMQCVDCHFKTDVHGNGSLYGEPRAATTIECIDCHGSVSERPTLITSGNGGRVDLGQSSTPWGPRFRWEGQRLYQASMMDPNQRWEVPQTVDTLDPNSRHYNAKSRYAKTLRRDGQTWGDVPAPDECGKTLAHDNSRLSCQVCHTSFATSCFGCHLPMRANQKTPLNKFEGITTRNFTSYNPQVLRDDVFMLGLDGTVKSNRLAVLRSSSAVLVSSQNANREWIYSQQQTVSAEGYSGQAFNPHFPHTTSGRGTTKNCTDCHLSNQEDNNAIMTQLLGLGTGTVNFFGRYAYVGAGRGGLHGVVWTEPDEPQAALGSHLQKVAYPSNFQKHEAAGRQLLESHHHSGEVLDLTLRGEYLYAACGSDGVEIFDVANIDQKGFSERIVTAPVSPLGQRTRVPTKYATSVALPATIALDPQRTQLPENEEQPIHPSYSCIYVTDREEGLVIINVGTLVDGNPSNNFLKKDRVFNPEGQFNGARQCYVAGRWLYLVAARGLFVVDIDDPMNPRLAGALTGDFLKNPRALAVQFRYLFVTDEDGFKTCDITDPAKPAAVPTGVVSLQQAGRLYVARTYAYVANGPEGLAIINVENPRQPVLDQMFNAGGQLNDTRAVQVGAISASQFALVADGRNGLRILQLISPENVPGYNGFSPRPQPRLIASFKTRGEAVAVSRGLDRDRIVDESGHQTVVFGRRGSRPFQLQEMERFYRHFETIYPDDPAAPRRGPLYKVDDIAGGAGPLATRKGGKLPAPVESKAPPSSTATPPAPSRDRVFRRGG